MIDESSSLRGVFSRLEAKKITPAKKDAEYASIEAMLCGDSSIKLIHSLKGLNICDILVRDITIGSTSVISILSILNHVFEADLEMVRNPPSVLRKLVMILESNLSEQKSVDLYMKALKCISLMCPTLKSLGKEGPAIKTIILQDIMGNQDTNVFVKLHALCLFKSLIQHKLLEDIDSNSWLKMLTNSVFDDNAILREEAIEALSIFKVHLTGNEEHLDTLANNLVPVKYSKMLIEMISVDKNWAVIWRLLIDLLGKRLHTNSALVNSLLAVEEKAFKTSNTDTKKDAFYCWNALIFNFALEQNVLSTDRRVKLLTIPLRANNCRHPEIARVKLNVWWNTIRHMKSDVMNYSDTVLQPFLNFCYGPVGESSHMSSNGQNRLNGPNAGESSAKLYPGIRVPCLHALCEILSKSAGIPLPEALAKELTVSSLIAPPITNQKAFCNLSRLLTQCLGEAVMLEGYNLQQTPYIIHSWKSLRTLIGRGTGDAISSVVSDSYSKDVKTISMVKELLRLLVYLVESSSSMPEGKKIGHTILSMIECMVAGEYALPTFVLNSHIFAIGSFLVMNSSPSLLLSVLFLSPAFSNDKRLYPRVKEVFSKVLSVGLNGAISPLSFAKGLLKKVDACASEQSCTIMVPYLQEIWISMANHLSDAIDKGGVISEGNDAGHDFHCIHGMLMFPLNHLLKSNLLQESLEPVIKPWKKLFELYFLNAQLLATTQSSDVVEELCRKIHLVYRKPSASLTCVANAIQFVLVMYSKPFCETCWKGQPVQESKENKVHGFRNSQQLLITLLYKIPNFFTSLNDCCKIDEESIRDHRTIISFLILIFNSAAKYDFSSFVLDKGLNSVFYYLKLTAQNNYKVNFGDEMIRLWENFLEYMEKKVLVVPVKTQSTLDSLSPLFISALKHPLTKLANITILRWNRSLGELCSKVEIRKSLSDALDDAMKNSSGSEDVLGKIVDKSSRILVKSDKNESPNKSMFHAPVATSGASSNKLSTEHCVEFKVIPPKSKTPVLTEHQKEMRKERRVDIPALYQDLTQDSVSQSFSQENSMSAVARSGPREFGEEDANCAFPTKLLAKQNFQSARKTVEEQQIEIFGAPEADKSGIVSNVNLNSTPAGDNRLKDSASTVAVEMVDVSLSHPTGKVSSTDLPIPVSELKTYMKGKKRKQKHSVFTDFTPTDSTESMNARSVVLPVNFSESGPPISEKDKNLAVILSSPTAAVVSDIAPGIPPADDALLIGASNQETGKLTADAINVNASSGQITLPKDLVQSITPKIPVEKPEKNLSLLQKSKIDDLPHGSSAPETEEDIDINTTSSPSGTLDVAKKHTRKSTPKKFTNLQNLKNLTKGSTKENESPSRSSVRNEPPSIPHENTNDAVKRRARPRRRTEEEQSCRVDGSSSSDTSSSSNAVNFPSEESVKESSKDTRGSNLKGKSSECKSQSSSSSSLSKDSHEKFSDIVSTVLPRAVVGNCDNDATPTVSERSEKDNGFIKNKTSFPGKLSGDEFSSSTSVEASAPSSCVDLGIDETVVSPKSIQSCASPKSKLLPGSPRSKSAGNSPNLDKWVIVTKRDMDDKSPKKLLRNSSSCSTKLENIKLISLDSCSDDASHVVTSEVGNGVSCVETPMTSNSEDIVDSSQDPLDSSISSAKGVTKKCAVHLPRVCDTFQSEVTFIQYEGRMLKCNLRCLANEGEVAVHSYSPNASPGGSLIKKKRPLEPDDSISPSSKKLRRVSFADPIVSRQVEFCVPESERKFKKRAVSRCLKLACMPQDESTEIMPGTSQLLPAKPLSDICGMEGANAEGEMIPSAELEGLNQNTLENLEEGNDARTSKPASKRKLVENHGLTFKSGSCKEVEHSSGELMSLNEVDKSEIDKSKNLPPAEKCGSDEGASLISESAGMLIEKDSCKEVGSAIQESPKKAKHHNVAFTKKEMAENKTLKYGNRNVRLKRDAVDLVSSLTQTEQPIENIDSLEKVVKMSPSTKTEVAPVLEPINSLEIQASPESVGPTEEMGDAPLLEPASSLEIQASPVSVRPMEEPLESLSGTEKPLVSPKPSESPEISLTESFTEEPYTGKLNTQEEVFPALRDCKDPVSNVMSSLASKIWRERCRTSLGNHGIRTIGDLSRLTADFVERIPIKHNKWNTLKSSLEEYYELKYKKNDSSESTSSVQVNGPCEMEVDVTDGECGTTFREMLSNMSSKDILKELKALNLTDSLLQEIENEKRSTCSQNSKTKEIINEQSKPSGVSGSASKIDTFSGTKPSETLQSMIERSNLKETVNGLTLEKMMQLLKCVVGTAHKKIPTYDGSVDIAARRILHCVLDELMNEGGSADMVKQLSWLFENTLFSKEYVKSIPSLLNIVDSSVASELILKHENIMENIRNQMTPAKAIKIAVDVLSQKNLSLLPEEDLNQLNDILDSSRTCEELFDRFTHIIKKRLSGNRYTC